jgi:hypothetical protein
MYANRQRNDLDMYIKNGYSNLYLSMIIILKFKELFRYPHQHHQLEHWRLY